VSKVELARLILGWQDVRKMNAGENQFSLTQRSAKHKRARPRPNSYE
jgi:hypothetical protein